MDEDEERRSLVIFGKDVTQIPCFRKSFLSGISCGVVGGLVTFMLTSKPQLASHMSVVTFVGSTWSYWMYCRYNWTKQEKEAAQLKLLMEQHAAFQGTPREKKLVKPDALPLMEA